MTRAEIIEELNKEFNPELGFFMRVDSKLTWNPRALMLWGMFFEMEVERNTK